jgi:hypothetical protein
MPWTRQKTPHEPVVAPSSQGHLKAAISHALPSPRSSRVFFFTSNLSSTTLFINTQAECAPDNHSRRRSFWVLCAYRLSRSFTTSLLFFLEFDQNTKRLFWEQLPVEATQLRPQVHNLHASDPVPFLGSGSPSSTPDSAVDHVILICFPLPSRSRAGTSLQTASAKPAKFSRRHCLRTNTHTQRKNTLQRGKEGRGAKHQVSRFLKQDASFLFVFLLRLLLSFYACLPRQDPSKTTLYPLPVGKLSMSSFN